MVQKISKREKKVALVWNIVEDVCGRKRAVEVEVWIARRRGGLKRMDRWSNKKEKNKETKM